MNGGENVKLRTKYLLSLPVAMVTTLYNYTAVFATGVGGVEVNGNGTITVDISQAGTNNNPTTISDFWNSIFEVAKYVVSGITGVLCICLVGVFAYKGFMLATAGGNPKQRQEAIEGMLYAFIGAAIMGGATLLSGLAFGLFKP